MKNKNLSKPNVIFIIVDMIKQNKIGASGYKPNITPNIDKIYLKGLRATQHFSTGSVTQVAFPSIFTSTLPLDMGGYNKGIKERPNSFPEILSSNGYETWGAVTGHPCCAHFGYDKGFDSFENLIDLYQWFRQMFRVELRYLIDNYKSKKYNEIQFVDAMKENYLEYLNSTIRYIDEMNHLGLPNNGWNRKKLKKSINKEIKLLKEKPNVIARKIIEFDQDFRDVIGYEKVSKKKRILIKLKSILKSFLNKHIFLYSERKAFPAHFVNQNFVKFLSKRNVKKPFFAYMHYFDVHEAKLLLSNFSLSKIFDFLISIYKCSNRDFKKGGLFYDIALSRVDREIGRLMKQLKKNNLDKDTIIVITGDHGTQSGYPPRQSIKGNTDLSNNFFDDWHHVPFFICGPGVSSKKTDILCSHLDLAPTILDILSIKSPISYLGKSILSGIESTKYIIAENTGNGNCDIKNKNIIISVRSKSLKIVYQIEKFHIKEREVYDIINDKLELNNLVNNNYYPDVRKQHFKIVKSRLNKLKIENNIQENT